jgi:hypothetical protein
MSSDRDVDVKPMCVVRDKLSNENDILRTKSASDLVAYIIGLKS